MINVTVCCGFCDEFDDFVVVFDEDLGDEANDPAGVGKFADSFIIGVILLAKNLVLVPPGDIIRDEEVVEEEFDADEALDRLTRFT